MTPVSLQRLFCANYRCIPRPGGTDATGAGVHGYDWIVRVKTPGVRKVPYNLTPLPDATTRALIP